MTLPSEVARGAPVRVELRLANTSTRAVDLALQGRPAAFDIIITDGKGRPVWRRLEGEAVVAVLQLRPLAPGQAITFEATWDQRDRTGALVPPGEYRVTGQVPSDPPAVYTTAPRTLRVRP